MSERVRLAIPGFFNIGLLLVFLVGGGVIESASGLREGDGDDPFRMALDPFWRAKVIRETVLFTETAQGLPEARLLFRPERVLKVTSLVNGLHYEEDQDYRVDAGLDRLVLLHRTRIPFKTLDQLFPRLISQEPSIRFRAGDLSRGVLWAEGTLYRTLQTEVTYVRGPGEWHGYVPRFAGESIPRTVGKLRDRAKLSIILLGDSISQGASSSKSILASPFTPSYGELVVGALQRVYPASQTVNFFRNYAVGGWGVEQGLEQAKDLKLGLQKPDLVIVAFGMNDVSHRDPAGFGESTKRLIDAIRQDSPQSEFLLVAPMLGNPEWSATPWEQFPLYRDALRSLTGPGIALADITAIWEEMLKRKTFFDLTGNGVNHPNDFGHMIYAQAILALVVPGPVAWINDPDQATNREEYILDARASLTGPNGPATYRWELSADSRPAVIRRSNQAIASVRFGAGPGTYSFQLSVTDARREKSTATLRVTYCGH